MSLYLSVPPYIQFFVILLYLTLYLDVILHISLSHYMYLSNSLPFCLFISLSPISLFPFYLYSQANYLVVSPDPDGRLEFTVVLFLVSYCLLLITTNSHLFGRWGRGRA